MRDEEDDLLEEISEDDAETPDFSRIGAIPDSNVARSKQYIEDLHAAVRQELDARGIPEPVKPSSHPRSLADTDIASLTNSEVASLYSQYVAYAAYIGDELAQIEGLEELAKKILRETLGSIKDSLYASGIKGAAATAAATKDALYQELDMEHAKLFFMKAIMKRRYRGYVSMAAALSRTVELRKLDFEQSRRDGNLGFGPKRATPVTFGSGNKAAPAKKA